MLTKVERYIVRDIEENLESAAYNLAAILSNGIYSDQVLDKDKVGIIRKVVKAVRL